MFDLYVSISKVAWKFLRQKELNMEKKLKKACLKQDHTGAKSHSHDDLQANLGHLSSWVSYLFKQLISLHPHYVVQAATLVQLLSCQCDFTLAPQLILQFPLLNVQNLSMPKLKPLQSLPKILPGHVWSEFLHLTLLQTRTTHLSWLHSPCWTYLMF